MQVLSSINQESINQVLSQINFNMIRTGRFNIQSFDTEI